MADLPFYIWVLVFIGVIGKPAMAGAARSPRALARLTAARSLPHPEALHA